MAKKKVSKPVAKKASAKKTIKAVKSIKPASKAKVKILPKEKPVVKKIAKVVGKIVEKTAKKIAAAVAPKSKEKIEKISAQPKKLPEVLKSKKNKIEVEEAEESVAVEENTGDTLIGMAKAEMAAVKIGQTAEKIEKANKFKAIKVERGNLADEKVKWQELNKRHGKDKAETYKMTGTFEALKPIQHKVLGWGFVLTNDNDRLEVLFENGIKMLISNYKPN